MQFLKAFCDSFSIILDIEREWNVNYIARQSVIITDTSMISLINEELLPRTTLVLKETDNFTEYMNKVYNYIFDMNDERQLIRALLTDRVDNITTQDIIRSHATYNKGDYNFNFSVEKFNYKKRGIYLTKGQQKFLYAWLILANKDTSGRKHLCVMRKKFGKDFLADVDKKGNIKEEKEEDGTF